MAAPPNPTRGTVKVLGFGLSRTGTYSTKFALEELGYAPTNHGFEVFDEAAVVDQWVSAIEAKFFGIGKPFEAEDWRRFLSSFQGVTDMPHFNFVDELLEAFPDAVVVATYRDPEDWWKSFAATIHQMFHPVTNSSPGSSAHDSLQLRRHRVGALTFSAFFAVPPQDMKPENIPKEMAIAAYEAHYEHLRAVVPKDRLLEFSVKDGWVPLCEFLGKPVPETPFPRGNEPGHFLAVFPGIIRNGRQGH
ncbi:unnamed protein product [Mycena citricolor]|uniref:Uncharacterized protein n=1 Tax=Mycena citricolor TaxID=2018698 RepID=A0AAD2JWK2_9AGAR|nr:unnamed protein product [Mycena citricolor]